MIDFLKSFYRRKSNSADPVLKRGYEVAQRARNNPFVRAYLDKLAAQYEVDERELDLKYAAYVLTADFNASGNLNQLVPRSPIDNSEDNIEEYARLVGVSDDLIISARVDQDAHALMRVHTRLGMEQKHSRASSEQTNNKQDNQVNTTSEHIDDKTESSLAWREFLEALPKTLGFEGSHLFFQKLGSGIRDYGNGSGSQTFHGENGQWTIYSWNLDTPQLDNDEREYATREILKGEVRGLKSLGVDVDYNGEVIKLPLTDTNQRPMHMGMISWNKTDESLNDEALALIIMRDLVVKVRGSTPDLDGAHFEFITVVSGNVALHSSNN